METDPEVHAGWTKYAPGVTLAQALKAARREMGHTQTQAAQAIGTTQVSLSNWEHGTVPDWGAADVLAGVESYLGISRPELLVLIGYQGIRQAERRVAL